MAWSIVQWWQRCPLTASSLSPTSTPAAIALLRLCICTRQSSLSASGQCYNEVLSAHWTVTVGGGHSDECPPSCTNARAYPSTALYGIFAPDNRPNPGHVTWPGQTSPRHFRLGRLLLNFESRLSLLYLYFCLMQFYFVFLFYFILFYFILLYYYFINYFSFAVGCSPSTNLPLPASQQNLVYRCFLAMTGISV